MRERTRQVMQQTNKRNWTVTALLSAISMSFVAGVGYLSWDHIREQEALGSQRMDNRVFLQAHVTQAQANAFADIKSVTKENGATILHPPAGAVLPSGFPAPRIQWTTPQTGVLHKVIITRKEEVLFEGFSRSTTLTPPKAIWDNVRRQPGKISLKVISAQVSATGTIQKKVTESAEAQLTIANKNEDPTGMVLFGSKHRPESQPTGMVPLLMMHLRIDGFDLSTFQHRVVFRSSYGPEPTVMHPGRMAQEGEAQQESSPYGGGKSAKNEPEQPKEKPGYHDNDKEVTRTQCVSCHALSSNGERIAVFSQTAEEAPPSFDAPNGFLTVLEMPSRKVIIQLPHAFMPQFNPVNPDLLAFGQVDETIGIKDQMMVRRSDIHVLNLKTLEHKPLPGADLKDRVENLPYWSPDGKRLAFLRTKPNEMWHGSSGKLDLAWIEYNDGAGGQANPLKGASDNDKSNFLPTYSNDGKWIVFTQADQGFFSQESSDLWIVPAEGGTPRRMGCNSTLTESWHRFSPDGRWLAFVTNREDVRRPHIYISRFYTETGTCAPAVQLPIASGPGAHTHAFSWTKKFDWLNEYEPVEK